MPLTSRTASCFPCVRINPSSSSSTRARVSRVFCVRIVHDPALTRAGRKTLGVVHLVERGKDDHAPKLPKARRLVAATLLEALDDRIRRWKWKAALKVFELLREQEWYEPDVATYVRLLSMLGKCRQAGAAYNIFHTMLQEKCKPSVEAFTALLTAYTRSNRLDDAFRIMEQMKQKPGVRPKSSVKEQEKRARLYF